jgi:site-specific DNA-methyltransferase (adenine-specific)
MSDLRPYWSSEQHGLRIYHGDCLDVLPALEAAGEEFDLCLTDIPYLISQASNGLRELHYGAWDVGGQPEARLLAAADIVTGTVCAFCHETQLSRLISDLEERGYSTRGWFWHKPNPTVLNGQVMPLPSVEVAAWGKRAGAYFGGHCTHNFSEWPVVRDDRFHPTQKPLGLMRELCGLCSPAGGTVLDPFLGSGTTLVAAYRLGREATGIEISEEYCELAARRLEQELAQGRLFEPAEVAQPRQEVLSYE